jgi:hypothetical protein
MPLPSKYDQSITLEAASKLTENYRQQMKQGDIKCGGFFKESVLKILAQDGCEGMRCYFGVEENGSQTLVLVGVDKSGNDMTGGELANIIWKCPPYCPDPNSLNS